MFFFSSFFEIKYQHFKPNFSPLPGLISLGLLIRPTERAYTISAAAVAYLGLMSSHNSGRCCGHRLVLFWSGSRWIGQRFSPLVKQRRQKPTVAVSCLCVTDYCVTAIHWHTFEAVYNRNVFCAERSIYFKCHLYNTCRRCPYSTLRVKKC